MIDALVLRGVRSYEEVHALQRAWVDARATGEARDVLLVVEHTPTVTVGRQKDSAANVLSLDGVDVVDVERGGNVTYHGPGQLVVYPILALGEDERDVHAYLRSLELAVIETLKSFGVGSSRDPRNTGVWIDGKKVCSIGVAFRRWVSWHGLALNLDVDLAEFQRIRPCGMGSEVMTRLADHLTPLPPRQTVADRLLHDLATQLNRSWSGTAREVGSGQALQLEALVQQLDMDGHHRQQ